MRQILLLFAIFLFTHSSAQILVKGRILDRRTNQPLEKITFYILKDHDKWIDINESDADGYFTGEIDSEEYDPNSVYHVLVEQDMYNIAKVPVQPNSQDPAIVRLTKNERYYPHLDGMTYKDCSSIAFGWYSPKEPRSLSDLPNDIRKKLVKHLIEKLGFSFYSKLVLSGGQIVDVDRLNIVDESIYERQWTAYPYYLCFSFRDTSAGIARYTANIVLDKNGAVIEDIDLPGITKDPSKENIISRQQALNIANGCTNIYTDAHYDFEYDSEFDCFVWAFLKIERPSRCRTILREVTIAAHNGQVLRGAPAGAVWY